MMVSQFGVPLPLLPCRCYQLTGRSIDLFMSNVSVPRCPKQEMHHRVSWQFLAHGTHMRRQLEMFVAGTPMTCLRELGDEVAKLRY